MKINCTNNLIEMVNPIPFGTNCPGNCKQYPPRGLIYGALIAGIVVLSPIARAQLSPAPDGGYSGFNTAEGRDALFNLDTSQGVENTAIGDDALHSNRTASDNTAIGVGALENNNADNNTATGSFALFANMTGVDNTATGKDALQRNVNGNDNTAVGFRTLFENTSGPDNTATGFQALFSNTSGADNTATGFDALETNSTGADNTADGIFALFNNTSGMNNTAAGSNALANNTTGSSNVALGFNAGMNLAKGNNNIIIGANVGGNSSDANTIRIGKSGTQQKTFIAGIFGKTAASGVSVTINSNGQLGTVQSSARFKDDIKPMEKASEALLQLKPVTFRYKEELDPDKIPQFGLIAEDVEKIAPDLITRDETGKPVTVRYEAVNAMLLNEFLKEHRKVQELKKQIQALKVAVQQVRAQSQPDSPPPGAPKGF